MSLTQESLAPQEHRVEDLSLMEYARASFIALDEVGSQLPYPQESIIDSRSRVQELIGVSIAKSWEPGEIIPKPGYFQEWVRSQPGVHPKWMWDDGMPEEWDRNTNPKTGVYADGPVPATAKRMVGQLLSNETFYLDDGTHREQRAAEVPKLPLGSAIIINDALKMQLEQRGSTMTGPERVAVISAHAWSNGQLPEELHTTLEFIDPAGSHETRLVSGFKRAVAANAIAAGLALLRLR